MGRRWVYLVGIAVLLGACTTVWGQKKASNPIPADGQKDAMDLSLRWTAGTGMRLHSVYLGTDPNLGPENLVLSKQTKVYYVCGDLEPGVTYYWRVDEVETDKVTTYTGDVWSFTVQALSAYLPDPPDKATTASPAGNLAWWPGQGAMRHHVFLSENQEAVTQGAAGADKGWVEAPDAMFTAGALQGATTYYWRVDEETPDGIVEGPVWSFTTVVLIDDFESYTNEEGKAIFETWIDGYVNKSGSTIGYVLTDADLTAGRQFVETTIIHGGLQSGPLDFNNLVAPYYSEAALEYNPPADWASSGVDSLLLYVHGRPVNFEIPYVSTPPTIDGKVDESWTAATILPLKNTLTGTGNPPASPADASGQFREMYDAANLYVLIDINDSSLKNDSGSAYLDDSVEVYVDGDNTKKGAGLVGNNRQYTFGWGATISDLQGTNTNTTGVECAQVDTPTGWRIEIKLPWLALLNGPAPVGRVIGVDCFYNDDDDGGETRERQIGWHSTLADDWQTPAHWGSARLAPAAGAPAKPDTLCVSLQDSANHTAVVLHPDPKITQAADWVAWKIPLSSFSGVSLGKITKMAITVGDKTIQTAGSLGRIYIDDICLTLPEPPK